eukprot:1040353-Karenia_brevis.AAC.1
MTCSAPACHYDMCMTCAGEQASKQAVKKRPTADRGVVSTVSPARLASDMGYRPDFPLHPPASLDTTRVGSMDLKTLTEALKPIFKEVVREEIAERFADLEARVDRADEVIQGLALLDPRITKLEAEVSDLKQRMADMEARMKD